jgi:hypothetical protein
MLSKLLAGLLGVGLLVCGTALGSQRSASALSITGTPSVTAKWHESYVKGRVSFSGTKSSAGQIEVSLRNVKTDRLIGVKRISVGSGAFTGSIALSARPVPGTYRLRLKEYPTGTAADRTVKIPSPPEGVIDKAWTSRSRNGSAAKVIKNAKIIYAHFHFVARPITKTLTFNWRKPGNPKVRFTGYARKAYKESISTFVCVKAATGGSCLDQPLRKGKWYCIVYANGKVVKRQDVTVR